MRILLNIFFGFVEILAVFSMLVVASAKNISPDQATDTIRVAVVSFVVFSTIRFPLEERIRGKCEEFGKFVRSKFSYEKT